MRDMQTIIITKLNNKVNGFLDSIFPHDRCSVAMVLQWIIIPSMRKSSSILLLFILLILTISLILSSCNTSSPSSTGSTSSDTTSTLSESLDGTALMQERCSSCHTTGRITSKSATLDEWTATVDRMISKGAQLDSVERDTLIQFLAQTYP
jgi:hypothetical protein